MKLRWLPRAVRRATRLPSTKNVTRRIWRPDTTARNARLTQPLAPRRRARPATGRCVTPSTWTWPAGCTAGGVVSGGGGGDFGGWRRSTDAESSAVTVLCESPIGSTPVTLAVFGSGSGSVAVTLWVQRQRHSSPGSSRLSASPVTFCGPVIVPASQRASSNFVTVRPMSPGLVASNV